MTNKEKFLALVSKEETNVLSKNKERIRSRAMLRESQCVATQVLSKLDQLRMTQKELSNLLEVSPQYVTKIVSGKENLTLETLSKLQAVLDIPLLASYYANNTTVVSAKMFVIEKQFEKVEAGDNQSNDTYQSSRIIKMERHAYSKEYDNVAV